MPHESIFHEDSLVKYIDRIEVLMRISSVAGNGEIGR